MRRARNPLPSDILVPRFYRRHPVVCGMVGIAVLAAVVDRVSCRRQGDDYARYHDRVFRVINVVDGDTLDIDASDGQHETTRIRLWGVDSPELARDSEQQVYFGTTASAYATQTLLGQPVRIELSPVKTRGLYDRLLAYVHLVPTGASFNELLLQNGYAYADWRFPHPLNKEYVRLEKQVRRNGAGLWNDLKFEDMPAWRRRMEKSLKPRLP